MNILVAIDIKKGFVVKAFAGVRNNYKPLFINKKDYLIIPDQIDKKNLFIEIRFICLRTKTFLNLEKLLLKYQISIKKVLSYEYVNSFKTDETDYISIVANKLINGLNKNEINLRKKYPKNIGFFEKFFKFFS